AAADRPHVVAPGVRGRRALHVGHFPGAPDGPTAGGGHGDRTGTVGTGAVRSAAVGGALRVGEAEARAGLRAPQRWTARPTETAPRGLCIQILEGISRVGRESGALEEGAPCSSTSRTASFWPITPRAARANGCAACGKDTAMRSGSSWRPSGGPPSATS